MSKPIIQFVVQTNDAEKKFRVAALLKLMTKDLKKSKSKTVEIGLGIQLSRFHDLTKEIKRLQK